MEVRCFRYGNEWSYARLGYRNNGHLTRMWMEQGSELLNAALRNVLLSIEPLLNTREF